MRIVFGKSSFNLKKVIPAEIGLNGEYYDGKYFLLKQYFIGFFKVIPFFPLEQEWLLSDNSLIFEETLELSHEEINALRQFGYADEYSTPVWTFTLSIVILCIFGVFIGLGIFSKIQDSIKEKEAKEIKISKNKLLIDFFQNPKDSSFVEINGISTLLLNYGEDSVQLEMPKKNLDKDYGRMGTYFLSLASGLNVYRIAKADVHKYIEGSEMVKNQDWKWKEIKITDAYTFSGPFFKTINYNFNSQTNILTYEVENIGFGVKLSQKEFEFSNGFKIVFENEVIDKNSKIILKISLNDPPSEFGTPGYLKPVIFDFNDELSKSNFSLYFRCASDRCYISSDQTYFFR